MVLGSTNYYENGFTFAACFQLWEGYLQCFYQSESYRSNIKYPPYLLRVRTNLFIAGGSYAVLAPKWPGSLGLWGP